MAKKKKSKAPKSVAPVKIDWEAHWAQVWAEARAGYGPPVDQLFTFGEVNFNQKWPDYSALGFTDADVTQLAHMACDVRLDYGEPPTTSNAPIHAMRILALRGDGEFLPTLFATFKEREDDDMFHEELPKLIGQIGAPAIAACEGFFAGPETSPFDNAVVANGLRLIAQKDRSLYGRIVDIFAQQLTRYEENSEEWNGFLIWDLIELAAGELLPLMEKAFFADAVDETICGDLDAVRAEFGLAPRLRDDGPRFLQDTHALLPSFARQFKTNKPRTE